jgi:uncharacterized protein (DUF302 family)
MATAPENTSGTEQTLTVPMRRHILHTHRGFAEVLDDIYAGISRPDIGVLFTQLADATTYQDFHDLVRQAQGSAGLMLFMQLDLDTALALDPQASAARGRRLVRVIAGNPVTMGQMTRHVVDAGSYAPVTILVAETQDGGTRVCYDTVASALAAYSDTQASQVAEHLDVEVLTLLRRATGTPNPSAQSGS